MQIYQADRLIDGVGDEAQHKMEVWVDQGKIQHVIPQGSQPHPETAQIYARPGATLLPGLIDVHVHLMFGSGGRTYEDVIQHDSDELMMVRGVRNAYLHLRAGVTTMRDMGARNNITFALRQAAQAGLYLSPRLQVCGRPLTMTGGHFWWCNQEANGVEGVRAAVRELMKDGADFLKIMASGGGTVGTDSTRASFTVAELEAMLDEAHQHGRKAAAHCLSADSIARCAQVGIDQIEHFNFLHPDGSRIFDDAVAEMIIQKQIVLSPTIQTGYRGIEKLERKKAGTGLSAHEEKQLEGALYKLETKLDFIGRFYRMGAPIVMGTDAIQEFGDYAIGLELLRRAGLSPMDVVRAGTSRAAQAMGMDNLVGAIQPGLAADLVYLEGNPLEDIHAYTRVLAVVLNGRLAVDKRLDMADGIPALADHAVFASPLVN